MPIETPESDAEAEGSPEAEAESGVSDEPAADVQALRQEVAELRETVTELREELADARESQQHFAGRIVDLNDEVEQVRQQVELSATVLDGEKSTRETRANTVRQELMRQAEARDGTYAMNYRQIKDALISYGHGDGDHTVHDPDAYQVMDDLDDVDGFTARKIGGQRHICVNLDSISALPGVNEINNAQRGTPAATPGNSGGERNSG